MSKRGAILSAALSVIEQEGLGGFTQPRVSQVAGMRQGHLTYYFPTRDELLVAVAQEAVQRRLREFEEVVQAPGPEERLDALVRVLTDPAQTRVLMALAQAADSHQEIRSIFRSLANAETLRDFLRAFGAPATAETVGILQSTATGMAVLALASDDDPVRRTRHLLEGLLRMFSESGRPSTENELGEDLRHEI